MPYVPNKKYIYMNAFNNNIYLVTEFRTVNIIYVEFICPVGKYLTHEAMSKKLWMQLDHKLIGEL